MDVKAFAVFIEQFLVQNLWEGASLLWIISLPISWR
jgi:hypothetical protein